MKTAKQSIDLEYKGTKKRLNLRTALISLCMFAFVGTSAQTGTVTVKLQNASVKELFSAIEKQTSYRFSYRDAEIKGKGNVTISATNRELKQLLEGELSKLGLKYTVSGNKIIVTPVAAAAVAQPKKVTGKVVDANGEPVIGATIKEQGTANGTITDFDGNFALDVADNAMLEVSYIGYKSQELQAVAGKMLSVTLREDTEVLDEVVVVGYGARKKETLTGSISKIDSEDFKTNPAPNLTASLGGQLPGLISINPSGQPGADSNKLIIRGLGTLGDNTPLIIVDGIESSSFDRIDPNDVESLSVLKDASAAIYGAKAANGVIIITTKKGYEGKPIIEYGYNYGISQPTKKIKVADAYTYNKYINAVYDNSNESDKKMSDADLEKLKTGADPDNYFANTDWWDETIDNFAPIQRHTVSIRGGKEDIKYFASAGYLDQKGIFKNGVDSYNQFNYRAKLDWKIGKYVQIGANLSGILGNKLEPTSDMRDIWLLIASTNPRYPAYFSNGLPWQGRENGDNPVVMVTDKGGTVKEKSYNMSNILTYRIDIPKVEGLFVDGWYAYNWGNTKNRRQQYPWTVYGRDSNGEYYPVQSKKLAQKTLTEKSTFFYSKTFNAKLNYVKKFGDHDLNVFIAFEQYRYHNDWLQAGRINMISTNSDAQLFMGGADGQTSNGSAYDSSRRNYFTRLSYNYKYKYFFDFTFRRDGSPIFPKDKRYGNFPSVSASWRITEEDFMKKLPMFTNLKLRASWGQLGNDRVGEYQYLTNYNLVTDQNFFGNSNTLTSAFYPGVDPNPNITWEVAQNANIGLEADLWNRLLSFEFDIYKNQRKNILITRNASIPDYIGLKLPNENFGKMHNSGFEFTVGHEKKFKDFEYNISFNFSKNKNEVVFIDEAPNTLEWQKRTGRPLGSQLYYLADGLYSEEDIKNDKVIKYGGASAGDVKLIDYNKDNVINGDDRVRLDKYTDIPGYVYGFSLGFKYKDFDFSAVFQGAGQIYHYLSFEGLGTSSNFLSEVYTDYWTPSNPDARWPKPNPNLFALNVTTYTTYALLPADYLRCSSMSLGYSLPKNFLSKIGIKNLRIYLNGSNLFTVYNKLKFFDPGAPSEGRGAYYPQMRIINMGATITF